MGQLQKIDHFVVLMLENRSFDSLLGELYPKSNSFEGLAGNEQNPDADGTPVVVWNSPGTDETTMRIPNPDPGELWTEINTQLFSSSAPASGQTPSMNGFVKNYLVQKQLNPQENYDPKSVMHYFTSDQAPVLSQLAKRFAVCARVPAVVVSPYVAPGSIFRQTSGAPHDHTSIIATVRKRFGLSSALTARDVAAPALLASLIKIKASEVLSNSVKG
jgi:phospholipase C